MKKNDYSQSLIFVIGNIDEAYAMSHSSDPDADADIFYEFSQKITVPRMKNALSHRFRMEQIGRLGNNIVIYPALSSNSYKLIIEKHLNIRVDYFKSEFGLDLTFTDSLRDIVYKESVFPTQGVRPVLSTFNTFIDSYVSKLVSDLILRLSETKELVWDFDIENSNHIFRAKENGKVFELTYPVKLHIEKLRKSDHSENQLYTAVHEAGHALAAIVKLKLIPKLVTSKTASMAEGFCRTEFPNIRTKSFMYADMIYALAGREAELAIFGDDNLSNGAGSDLSVATSMAVNMVKVYGMGTHSFQIQNSNSPTSGIFSEEWSKEAELQAINIFKKAEKETKKIIGQHLDKVIELSEYLTIHPKIEHSDLKEMVDRWGLPYKDKDNYFQFKDLLKKKKEERVNCPKIHKEAKSKTKPSRVLVKK
jgi:cell division protease FtsH